MVTMYDSMDDPSLIAQLHAGAVGILPTDTVYGLVCRADNAPAVARLYSTKTRENKRGVIIAANVEQLIALGFPARYLRPVAHYWPNSISIETPAGPALAYLHNGFGTIALRVPAEPALRAFLLQTGPLLTTSANLTNQPPASNITEAQAYFGDSVDFYVDGGNYSGKASSTLIRVVDDVVDVIRQGAVKINQYGEIEHDT